MIDIDNLGFFDADEARLQEWWLFCLTTGGAPARRQAERFNKLLSRLPEAETPFEQVRCALRQDRLDDELRSAKLGKYRRLHKAYRETLDLDLPLSEVELGRLAQIYGSGMKTARLFVLYSRENAEVAVLDVHVLRRLAAAYPGITIPTSTPQGAREYLRVEGLALSLARSLGKSHVDFDKWIWREGARRASQEDPRIVGLIQTLLRIYSGPQPELPTPAAWSELLAHRSAVELLARERGIGPGEAG